MASGISNREERRRKILERGSDRMALIFTGRSQSFSSAPPSLDDISSPSLRIKGSSLGSYDDLASVSNGYDISSEALERKLKSIKDMLDMTKREMLAAAAAAAAASRDNTCMVEPPPPVTSAIQKRSTDPPKPYRSRLFSSKRFHSCIIESENARGFCAFIIAVLVVLSYVGYPLFGSHVVKTESIIAAKPLYILLLTDLTIIMARLLLSAGEEDMEDSEEKKLTREDINSNWDGAVKLLERGLVVYQSVRGIFIDCSVYMVVVVCGLSQI